MAKMQAEYLDEYYVIEETDENGQLNPYVIAKETADAVETILEQNREDGCQMNEQIVEPVKLDGHKGQKMLLAPIPASTGKQKVIKRKANTNESAVPTKKGRKGTKQTPSGLKLQDEIILYAYKDCLGTCNSLVQNENVVLWLREGDFLMQKLMRSSYDDYGLFFKGSRTYSCWVDEEAWMYLPIRAVVVAASHFPVTFQIMNLDEIEKKCVEGNFKSLKLEPYTPCAQKANQNNNNDNSGCSKANESEEAEESLAKSNASGNTSDETEEEQEISGNERYFGEA